MKEALKTSEELFRFIEKCPSVYHVVEELSNRYEQAGFEKLPESGDWKLAWGRSYYVTRNGSALIAFSLPKRGKGKKTPEMKGFHIAAAHCDSPTFQVKENPERSAEGYTLLNVEKYGGMIQSGWFDRPLSVAGRVAFQGSGSGEIQTKNVNLDRDLLVIPSLAIHMNPNTNKGQEFNPQVDLQPLFSLDREKEGVQGKGLLDLIAEEAGLDRDRILGHDLYLYVREKGRFLGPDREMILSPRLDDLQCVFALTEGHLACKPKEYITLCAVFDNEEVGSGSIQGADSTFLEDVLENIGEALEVKSSILRGWIAGGFLISADNAHGVHPNHPEKADPTNRPMLGKGIVIKFSGARKYTTDGVSAARIRSLCHMAGVPCQTYANRSDIAGGSTLGRILTAHVSIPAADIGLPQLAMHSAVETAGTADTLYAVKLMQTFFGL